MQYCVQIDEKKIFLLILIEILSIWLNSLKNHQTIHELYIAIWPFLLYPQRAYGIIYYDNAIRNAAVKLHNKT